MRTMWTAALAAALVAAPGAALAGAQGGKLPADLVTVATGRLEFALPPGGGAGGAPQGEGREGGKEPKDRE